MRAEELIGKKAVRLAPYKNNMSFISDDPILIDAVPYISFDGSDITELQGIVYHYEKKDRQFFVEGFTDDN